MKSYLYKYVSLVILFLAVWIDMKAQDVSPAERQALVNLYESVGGIYAEDFPWGSRQYNNFSGNLDSGRPIINYRKKWDVYNPDSLVKDWHGVLVRDNHVIGLFLAGLFTHINNIGQVISGQNLSNLTYLRFLDLSNTNNIFFSNTAPFDLSDFDALEELAFGRLHERSSRTVTFLCSEPNFTLKKFIHNNFSPARAFVTAPPDISNLRGVETFHLYGSTINRLPFLNNSSNLKDLILTGLTHVDDDYPPEWGDLQKLEKIFLNTSASSLPEGWGKLPVLQELTMRGHSSAEGGYPDDWKELINLKKLVLDRNKYNNLPTIDSEFSMESLEILQIFNHTNLPEEYRYPSEWEYFPSILSIELDNNNVRHGFPDEWDKMATLKTLIIENHEDILIEYNYPNWDEFSSLNYLLLDNISIGGNLPESWKNFNSLEQLTINDNTNLEGNYPINWHDMPNLVELTLNNNFNSSGGVLPAWNIFPNLKRLVIGNHLFLNDAYPSSWSQINSLEELYLYRNSIDKNLPSEWGEFQNLNLLSIVDNNKLEGSYPKEWANMLNLKKLVLEGNSIAGILPEEWGEFQNLEILEVSRHRRLTGPYPTNWKNIFHLKILVLESNRLIDNDTLPVDWNTGFDELTSINISRNGIDGKIPQIGNDISTHKDYSFNNFVYDDFSSYTSRSKINNQIKIPAHQVEITVPLPTAEVTIYANERLKHPNNKYQWYFRPANTRNNDFLPIGESSGGEEKDLTLTNLTENDFGYYMLEITNPTHPGLSKLTQLKTELIKRELTGDPNPPPVISCPSQPYLTIADLPIPNGGSNVIWYESNEDDEQNQSRDFEEDPYDLDEEVAPGETYWAAVDGNPQRVSFTTPEDNNTPGVEDDDYQAFAPAENATIADLNVTITEAQASNGLTQSDITWHSSRTSVNALPAATILSDGLYYAAFNGNGCRLEVEVEIYVRDLEAPGFQDFCAIESPTVANLAVFEDYGLEVRWYNQSSGGGILDNSVPLVDNTNYYGVLSDGENESEIRRPVLVRINDTPAPVLSTEELVVYIQKNQIPTVNDIILPGSENLQWYLSEEGLVALEGNDVIEDGVTYYATQSATGQNCVSKDRLEAKIKIEVIPPPRIILCEKFRPELGERYVFNGWVRQLGLKENTSQTITINRDSEAKNLLLELINEITNNYVFSNAESALEKFLPPIYIPSPGTRKYDALRKYVIDAPTDTFTIYNFKYVTDSDVEYPIVTNPTDINNIRTTRRVRRTIGFQFSFKPYANPNEYDVKYLTPIYDQQRNRRYPLFNNPTLSLAFNNVTVPQPNRVVINGNFSIDKGATNYINSNTVSNTLLLNNFKPSYDIKTFIPDPDYQVEEYTQSLVEILFEDQEGNELLENTKVTFETSGKVIDGWQRISASFVVPIDAGFMTIILKNTEANNNINSYFDDIRVHPYDSNLKSFVYDPETQRLQAELDENNYATYYEYDKEGGLVRVKKETERGVYTIQETRSSTRINGEN